MAGIVGDDSEDAGGPQPAGSTRPVRQAPDQRPAALAQEFYATWGREPTLAELAGLFGEGRSPSSDVLRGVLVATRPLTYLDSERFRDSVAPLSEFIADGTVAEVSAVVVRKQARELLEACIRELPDRERGKRHHYIPCMLLSRFGEGKGRDAQVWVFDKHTGAVRRQKVENVAYEKFLYRVPESVLNKDEVLKLPEHMRHVDGMEDVFQAQEDIANRILDSMATTARLPEPPEMEFLLWFVLMLESRNPRHLEHIRQMTELMVNAKAKVAAYNDPALFGGAAPDIQMTFDKNRHYLIGQSLNVVDDLMPYMMSRKWTLRASTVMRGGFVCGDVPVIISLTVPSRGFNDQPAHAVNRTMLSVPLSSRLLLTGEFEGKGGVAAADERWVGYANAVAFSKAERFVYSRWRDFPIMLLPSLVPARDAVDGISPVIPFDAEGFSAKAKDGRFKRPRQLVNPDALPQIDRILAGYAAMNSERHEQAH